MRVGGRANPVAPAGGKNMAQSTARRPVTIGLPSADARHQQHAVLRRQGDARPWRDGARILLLDRFLRFTDRVKCLQRTFVVWGGSVHVVRCQTSAQATNHPRLAPATEAIRCDANGPPLRFGPRSLVTGGRQRNVHALPGSSRRVGRERLKPEPHRASRSLRALDRTTSEGDCLICQILAQKYLASGGAGHVFWAELVHEAPVAKPRRRLSFSWHIRAPPAA